MRALAAPYEPSRTDLWIRRLTAAALAALTLALLGLGVALYAPSSHRTSEPLPHWVSERPGGN